MGRLTARILLLNNNIQLVHINELVNNADLAAYLLEFDSTHGKFALPVAAEGSHTLVVNSTTKIGFSSIQNPQDIPWPKDVDVIFECTGSILTVEKLEKHFFPLCKPTLRVVVSAPVEGILNVVMGCNEHLVTKDMRMCTAASCTTNCAAPIVGALDQAFGVDFGTLTTAHNVTPTQTLMDVMYEGKKKDFRRARSGASNLSPTSTGSAKAIAMIYPHLKGRLNGLAIRVPLQNASLTDMVLVVKKDVTREEVNAVLQAASNKRPEVLGVDTRGLVSSDFLNDARSAIVDAESTQVVAKRMIKVFAWYDNEWGYVNRMVDLAQLMATMAVQQQARL